MPLKHHGWGSFTYFDYELWERFGFDYGGGGGGGGGSNFDYVIRGGGSGLDYG